MTVLVVEGPSDAALMEPLIAAADLANVEVIVAGGKSSALSLGNSIALSRRDAVAVLADADTTDRRAATEQQMVYSDLQHNLSNDIRCKLFLAFPTLELELFPDTDKFLKIYNISLTAQEKTKFSINKERIAKIVMTSSVKKTQNRTWHGKIDPIAARDGWGRPLLRQLLSFLRDPDASNAVNGSKMSARRD